jgi:hypothetical protein
MDIKEIEKRRHGILEAFTKELNDSLIAAVLNNDEGAPESVSAILDELGGGEMEVLGEFFFRQPETEDDGAQVFTCVFTIADDIPAERLPALYEAISYVNFSIPAGCFSIDKDHRFFCYVLSTFMPADLEDSEVFREIDLAAGNAMAIADTYIGILSDVLEGTIDADGVVEFLGGPAEE